MVHTNTYTLGYIITSGYFINWLLYNNPVHSQTFWSQDPFVLLKIVEGPKELLIYIGCIY